MAPAGENWRRSMPDNVIRLDDHRPHVSAYVACLDCGKDWFAAAPEDVVHFECPSCLKMSGVVVTPSSAEFINAFMRKAKRKADVQHRTMVILNAQRMIDAGAFDA